MTAKNNYPHMQPFNITPRPGKKQNSWWKRR